MTNLEVYKIAVAEFMKTQSSEVRKARINALADLTHYAGAYEIAKVTEQSATESAIEIIINALTKAGIFEDAGQITLAYRQECFVEAAQELARNGASGSREGE